MEYIIGGILGLLVGAAASFFLQKPKITRKEKQLQQMQNKLEQSERDSEVRLQNTVTSVREESQEESNKLIKKIEEENEAKIEELEISYQAKIEELNVSNSQRIEELEKFNLGQIEELEKSHQDRVEKLQKSHQEQIEEAVNNLKQEYETKIKELESKIEELESKNNLAPEIAGFEELLEGLPSIEDSSFDSTETGLTDILNISSEHSSLPETTDETEEDLQQLGDIFDDLPSLDDREVSLEDLEGDRDDEDGILNDPLLDLEQKPLEDEIQRLSDLLDAFPTISDDQKKNSN